MVPFILTIVESVIDTTTTTTTLARVLPPLATTTPEAVRVLVMVEERGCYVLLPVPTE
jgi:hypothetical protein